MTMAKKTVQSMSVVWQKYLKRSIQAPSTSRALSSSLGNPSYQIIKSPPLVSLDLPDIWTLDSIHCNPPSIRNCTRRLKTRGFLFSIVAMKAFSRMMRKAIEAVLLNGLQLRVDRSQPLKIELIPVEEVESGLAGQYFSKLLSS
ncbi:hypothetical protein F0562_017787 [Nyssa sinensis]|uniref:Uncharacterized protein n=1 Tax=Nyssa sinensis TaxID=561372 RepID=A0A5J4ZFZ3_9ASTE|nr:hypothetical protein F0562_017787 [Nyssa sinensis]